MDAMEPAPAPYPFHLFNRGSRKYENERVVKNVSTPPVFPNKQYTKILFIVGHSTVCEDHDLGCSSLPVFSPPVDVLFTASYGDLLGMHGLFYDVLRRFCSGLRVQQPPQFSLPTIANVLTQMNRAPPPGLTGYFHNLNLSFHEQRSDTSNMFLFQPGEGFDTIEASGVYLIDPTNIRSLLPTTSNGEIESHNLFSNADLLSSLGITKTARYVVQSRVNDKINVVYRYNNPSFIRTSGANPRAQRVKLSYLLSEFETKEPGMLDNALIVVASCRGFEGADERHGIGYNSPRRHEFDQGSDSDGGGNKKRHRHKKRSHKKSGKKRSHTKSQKKSHKKMINKKLKNK